MRHPCPTCSYPNPAGTERCQGCGAVLAGSRIDQIPTTRKAAAQEPVLLSPPPTRPVPRESPAARTRSRGPKQLPDTELLPQLPQLTLPDNPTLRQWMGLPEKAPDGTIRFSPQHSKSLFTLVCFGPLGTPIEFRLLRSSEMVLGREGGFLQIIHDPAVSGRHAQLAYRDDMSLTLTDLNSTNGTFFRVRPQQGYRLWDTCSFIIGQQVFTFRSWNEATPPAAPARAQTVPIATTPKSETGFGKLVHASANDPTREFTLIGATMIGRATDKCQIAFPNDPFISPVHARLDFNVKLQQAIVTDLKSMNGVYVQIRQPVVLEDGDMFRLGEQIFGVIAC